MLFKTIFIFYALSKIINKKNVNENLPTFQHYNLQSDWESASEAEDSGISSTVGAQLEQISKEHIYQAYRNSLDKYQKYRGRYTEIVRRYREIEKDNAKARQVLVETQDKALRRISELKEQCQLEQQAKAHLENALRLEMDDLQCVVKTLKTKLQLLGENPDSVLNGSTSSKENSLINFSSDGGGDGDTCVDQNEFITRLETELKELRQRHAAELSKSETVVKQLTEQVENSQREINELKMCEEDNNITMAQNKMMIHSELENKEAEVKKLRDMVATLEANEESISSDLKALKEKFSKQTHEFELVSSDKLKLEDRLKEVFEEKKTVNNELKEMKDKIEKVNNKFKELSDDKSSLQNQNEQLNVEIKKCKDEINELQRNKVLLSEEIKSIKIINESTESEAINALQENMRKTMADLETQLSDSTRNFNKIIEEKTVAISSLDGKNKEIADKLKEMERERDSLCVERDTCKSKIESLKSDKRDFEKTLEREIREKNELKVQVTNILQEIGRLEEQLKEVRMSHASIQSEKQKLEEKIEKIQRQHNESKSKLEKDQTQKQAKVKELETKLHEIQCENSQLAEKNCLLEESSRRNNDELKRLQSNLNDSQDTLRQENLRLNHSTCEMEDKILTLNDRITQLTSDHARLFDEKEQLDHQHRSLQDANEAKEKEKLCLIEDLKSSQDEMNKCKAKMGQLENEKSNLTECCDNLRIVVNNIKVENEAMIKTRDELQKSFESMKTEMDKLIGSNKNLNERNKTLKSELDALNAKNQNRLVELENMLKQTHDEKQSLTESLHKNATDIEKKMKNYEEIKMQNEYLQTLVNKLQTDLGNAKEELASLSEKISKTDESDKTLASDLEEKKIEIKNLQESIAKMSAENTNLEIIKTDLTVKVKDLETKLSKVDDYDNIKEQLNAQVNEKSATSKKLTELEEKLNNTQHNYEALKSEKDALENEKKLAQQKLALLENQLNDFESKSASSHEKLKSIENELQLANEKLKEFQTHSTNKDSEITELNSKIQELSTSINSFSDDKIKLEKEIESSRSIISDLNKDFNDHLKEIEVLKEEKASLIEQVETHNTKLSAIDKELNAVKASKTSDKYESLQNENAKLQEANNELLEKLENLEKSSERRISDMLQELEELQENSQHFAQINSELGELKIKYDQLMSEKNDDENANIRTGDDDKFLTMKSERDGLADKLKKIMIEVEDVSNKNMFLEQKVENYLILEQSNERLKLQNEKLVRQLDETLVSFKFFYIKLKNLTENLLTRRNKINYILN